MRTTFTSVLLGSVLALCVGCSLGSDDGESSDGALSGSPGAAVDKNNSADAKERAKTLKEVQQGLFDTYFSDRTTADQLKEDSSLACTTPPGMRVARSFVWRIDSATVNYDLAGLAMNLAVIVHETATTGKKVDLAFVGVPVKTPVPKTCTPSDDFTSVKATVLLKCQGVATDKAPTAAQCGL